MIKQLDKHIGSTKFVSADSAAANQYKKRYGESILGIAFPNDTNELRAIVLAASKIKFAIQVHGFAAPGLQSSKDVLLIDLKNMNQIIEVNTKSAYALIEPGVTNTQLYKYLQDNKTGLWVDCDRDSLGSIASSFADHEFGYTPYGDHVMMQCGMEVMLANGELVRTTMGALPGNNIWQLFKWGFGPWVDPIFTQSNLGIITKIGLWLMPAPPAYKPFMLSLKGKQDIAFAVEILRDLKINVIVPNSVVISNALLDALPYIKRDDYLSERGLDIEKIKTDFKLGEWNVYGALYNTPDNVDVLWPMVSGALGSIDGSILYTDENRKEESVWTAREGLMRGIPVDKFDDLNQWQGTHRCDIGIACPPSGEDIVQLNALVADILHKYQFDNLSECVAGWRSIVKRIYFLFDDESRAKSEKCINELIKTAAEKGFSLTHSRSNHPDVNIEQSVDPGMKVLQEYLKTALDPENVLS
jgi:4-cresol dehydrogenase (hydroxylating) flavoprotein subunit